MKFYKSKMISRRKKVRLYKAIIRPTLTYDCKAWTTTKNIERGVRIYENKVIKENM